MNAELIAKTPTFAVASDLSDVLETRDGFGSFATKREAVGYWIGLLEEERAIVAERIRRAKRLRAAIRARAQSPDQTASLPTDLLPCPICGDADIEIGDASAGHSAVYCSNCGEEESGPNDDAAIAAWNARSLDHEEG